MGAIPQIRTQVADKRAEECYHCVGIALLYSSVQDENVTSLGGSCIARRVGT